jgi:hypothetical protein
MTGYAVKLGAVVRDSYGQAGIICTEEPEPPSDWIDHQLDVERIKALGKTNWWGISPFGGGYLLVAEPLLTYLRAATYEDFLEVADTAGVVGRQRLAEIFPHYVNRLLTERGSIPKHS